MSRCVPIVIIFALCVGACGPVDETPPPFHPVLEPLALETAPGSMAPNVAVADDGRIVLSWIEPREEDGHALRYALYDPATSNWVRTGTAAEGNGWFVNWADVPAVVPGTDVSLTAFWLAYNGEGTYAYGIRVRRSPDGGAHWEDPSWLHDDDAPAEHGFVSVVPNGAGLTAVWLDGRKFAGGTKEMTLRSRVLNTEGTPGPEIVLDDRTCDCCPTTATALPEGGMLVAYRDRTEEEIRDIYTVRYDGQAWGAPTRVADDGWHIAGCPVNGPALKAEGERVALAWFTAAADDPRVQVAFSTDGGRTFGPGTRVDVGHPAGRVDLVVLPGGDAVVAWLEGTGPDHEAGLYARRLTPDGRPSEAVLVQPSAVSRAAGYPRMARAGDDLFFAWTETGETRRVRVALAAL